MIANCQFSYGQVKYTRDNQQVSRKVEMKKGVNGKQRKPCRYYDDGRKGRSIMTCTWQFFWNMVNNVYIVAKYIIIPRIYIECI